MLEHPLPHGEKALQGISVRRDDRNVAIGKSPFEVGSENVEPKTEVRLAALNQILIHRKACLLECSSKDKIRGHTFFREALDPEPRLEGTNGREGVHRR